MTLFMVYRLENCPRDDFVHKFLQRRLIINQKYYSTHIVYIMYTDTMTSSGIGIAIGFNFTVYSSFSVHKQIKDFIPE